MRILCLEKLTVSKLILKIGFFLSVLDKNHLSFTKFEVPNFECKNCIQENTETVTKNMISKTENENNCSCECF